VTQADVPGSAAAETVWLQQNRWSVAASRLKRSITRSRALALAMMIAAAVFGALAVQLSSRSAAVSNWLAFGAALAVGLGPVVGASATAARTRDWTRSRAVSESLKADVYAFLARVAPFGGADREEVLLDRMERLLGDAADLRKYAIPVTPAARRLPAVTDLDSYVGQRLTQQIEGYYRPRAAEMRRRLRAVRVFEIALGVAGAVLAALAATFEVRAVAAWVGVSTTLISAVMAHAATSRYEYQQIEYQHTGEELDRMRARYHAAPEEVEAASFIERCEALISVQNEAWMVRLGEGSSPSVS
jgi:hypothetical protein